MEHENFDLLAASLRGDSSDARTLIEGLAAKLETALPRATQIDRAPVRFLSSKKRITEIKIKLGSDTYTLSLPSHSLTALRSKTVGGVTIRNEELTLDEWLNALTERLRDEARRSAAVRAALQNMLG